jgi:hypothetical protein
VNALDDQPVRKIQSRQILLELAPREARVEQRSEEHVAGDAREAVEMQDPSPARLRDCAALARAG